MPPHPWQVRPISTDELDAFLDVPEQAFGSPADPAERRIDQESLELSRCLACVEADPSGRPSAGEAIVGTATAFTFTLSVPAAVLPAAGVTLVAVTPTHRRRGILTALMRRQLADVGSRGEPLAVLFASEAAVYGRYGYGAACAAMALTVQRPTARLRTPAGNARLRAASAADAQPELARVYARVCPSRPGFFARDGVGWRMRLFDPPGGRAGASPLRVVLHTGPDGATDGYALYRTKAAFTETQPDGEVTVVEVLGADATAAEALWHYLLGLDLMARTSAVVAPDDPLLGLLVDPYAARPRLTDNLWVRLVDLPAALSGRRYAAPVDVTLDVSDSLLPANAGRWHLRGGPDGASCVRSGDPPDLALDTEALAAAYLGGSPLMALAGAGQVRENAAGSLATASTAFGWPRQPFCPQLF